LYSNTLTFLEFLMVRGKEIFDGIDVSLGYLSEPLPDVQDRINDAKGLLDKGYRIVFGATGLKETYRANFIADFRLVRDRYMGSLVLGPHVTWLEEDEVHVLTGLAIWQLPESNP
jgi:hypothetical protein